MKFLHIADVHFGKQQKIRSINRGKEIAVTFERIVNFSNANQVDFILCAGDLIDSESVSFSDLFNLRDIIAKLNCNFYCVSGNHDPLGEKSVYHKADMPQNFKLAPPGHSVFLLPEHSAAIHTFGWAEKELTQPFSFQKAPDPSLFNILLLHADTAKSSRYLPVDINPLCSAGIAYIALGHIHKPAKIHAKAAYAGSPEPLDSSETGPHGFFLCTYADGALSTNFVPFSLREFAELQIDVTPADSSIAIRDKIFAATAKLSDKCIPVIHITGLYSPRAPIDTEEMESSFADYGRVILLRDETGPDFDLELLYAENKDNAIGRFIGSFGEYAALGPNERNALRYGLCALLGYGEASL